MKTTRKIIFAAALIATSAPAVAADVGVSISIGDPGFYGRLDIGDFPQPRVIYRQPVVIERVQVVRPPIYLRVAPGHAKNWRKHCGRYDACGERVYFVQDTWYSQEYAPRYRERHGRRDHDGGKDRGRKSKNDRHDDDRGRGRNH